MTNENVLSAEGVVTLKKCGKCLATAMEKVKTAVRPGITTKELDRIANEALKSQGCVPSFLNYYVEGAGRFPASLCISLDNEIVHGIPSDQRIVGDGDIVSLDLGAGLDGIYTDMASTVIAGGSNKESDHLLEVTEKAMYLGIDQAVVGNRIGDIGNKIESYVLKENLDVVRDYVGHGIGKRPHMWPQIPNFGKSGSGPKIVEHMALAIEPMVVIGDAATQVLGNGWTVTTSSGASSAHFEHTVIIENGKPVIVTTL